MVKCRRRTSFKLFNKLLVLFGFSFVLYFVFNYSSKDPYLQRFENDQLSTKAFENFITNQDDKQEENKNDLVNIKRLELVKETDSPKKKSTQFIQPINAQRLNSLFDIMLEKEHGFELIFDSLNLFVFKDMIQKSATSDTYKEFAYELENYLRIDNGKVRVTESFVDLLNEISNKYSFEKPRTSVEKAQLPEDELKPTIVTAANAAYYDPLQATLYHVHKHFPNYKIVVYDLGLNEDMVKNTIKNCKCELRTFDSNKTYEKAAPHARNLKIFTWKPLIVQESLRDFKSIIYVDSSIRFKSGEIAPILNVCKETGILTQYIGFILTSFTNPKMFEWFHETSQTFDKFFTIEANIFFFYKNFINALLMKFWVTCALHEDCIAPKGTQIHRYDQDAITIITSYFYGCPIDKVTYLPAYSFTTQESYFFDVRRYEGMNYFTKNS